MTEYEILKEKFRKARAARSWTPSEPAKEISEKIKELEKDRVTNNGTKQN